MAEYIEGKRAVIEALRARVPAIKIILADNLKKEGIVTDILRKAKQQNIQVSYSSKKKLDEISSHGAHQGVVLEVKDFAYVSVREILAQKKAAAPQTIPSQEDYSQEALSQGTQNTSSLIVVADHITDAGNLGAIIRSAESVGACGFIIPNKRSASVSAATYKTSAGAVNHLPIARVANLSQTLEDLKKEGFWVAAATEHAKNLLWDANLTGNIVLVLGNEETGISRLVQEHCDIEMALPQCGKVSSLNVAQAATACMYEWLRQNRA